MLATNSTNFYSTLQVRELDRIVIQEYGIPGFELMQRAGESSFRALKDNWPNANKVAIFTGKGNNGGDGYVLAKLLHLSGMQVCVYQIGDVAAVKGDAKSAYNEAKKINVEMQNFLPSINLEYDLIVDAMLGTGLAKEVKGDFKDAIALINKSNLPVLSLDIPSGLDGNTGMPLGVAVKADKCISFIGQKIGLQTAKAKDYCRDILFSDLAIPDEAYKKVEPTACLITSNLLEHLPQRKYFSNKGYYGHVLIIGGNYGMSGAAVLAALSALRSGAGKVTIATRGKHSAYISLAYPEIMCQAVESEQDLESLLTTIDVLVVGPGIGNDDWAHKILNNVLNLEDLPIVLDADGLNFLATNKRAKDNWILTPHPGEAARLLDTTAATINNDRYLSASKISEQFGGVCVLKGYGTIISSQNQKFRVCNLGNPGMATAGMGDVLSGIMGALLGQKVSLCNAAALGVYIHAKAGDEVAQIQGMRGMLATDLISQIPKVVNF